MILEIALGGYFGSISLQADGWHMGTHAAALSISLFAYRYARHHAQDPRFTFGTGKVGILGGFTSAVVLLSVAILMMIEAIERLLDPRMIQFEEALVVAIIGLAVNLVSVRILGSEHQHSNISDHDQVHHNDQESPHYTDHNLRAAYIHVRADALTSILAILALLAGKIIGWLWLDAVVGILGGLVISRWAIGLLGQTGHILLDRQADSKLADVIRTTFEEDADTRLCDLHVWNLGTNDMAAIISLVTHFPRPVEHYRQLIATIPTLKHVTIEIHPCEDEACMLLNHNKIKTPAQI